jgi:hypothetical protein
VLQKTAMMMKWRRIAWAGNSACIEEKRNSYNILLGNPRVRDQ